VTFPGLTGPQWHAALNDFPVALLTASVAFDLLASGGRREAMRAAAYWTLLAGAAAAVLAAVAGLLAARAVEPSPVVDRLLQTHRLAGLALGLVFAGLAGWRAWRKNRFSEPERQSYIMVALVGALALLWTSQVGGNLVFRHAAGIPSPVLEAELDARGAAVPGEARR
jgi:uncharacterized membrane protein